MLGSNRHYGRNSESMRNQKGSTSHSTHYRSLQRHCCQSTETGWFDIYLALNLTRPTSLCHIIDTTFIHIRNRYKH